MSRIAAPVIVIGAARSGTKVLRDLIASHPRFRAVPYDVNYLWRMGTESVPYDDRDPADATPWITARVREQLGRLSAPGSTWLCSHREARKDGRSRSASCRRARPNWMMRSGSRSVVWRPWHSGRC